jgi:peptidyl-prolyl cis-trans isomerase SurA
MAPFSCLERLLLLVALVPLGAVAQPKGQLIDRVVAVVGREPVLQSDLAARVEQARMGDPPAELDVECDELEDLLFERLLLEQARVDSVTVDEKQVESELERRIDYFSRQIGGRTELEKFYKKSIAEIKADFRDQVREQLLVQTMQQRITANVRITPRDVQRFYNKIPADSIPFINAEVEYAVLLRMPKPSEEEERRTRRRAQELRDGVVDGGKDFCTMAMLYSEDPGSAKNCGELGMVPTGVMVPEFDAVALSLRDGEVSQVFKTDYGYHFMRMIERRGEQYNAQHVLVRPKVSNDDIQREKNLLDTLVLSIRAGRISFANAAATWSDDEESRNMNGMMVEPVGGSTRWDIGSLDQQTFFVLDRLKPGEVSDPQLVVLPDGSKAYRLLQLLVRTEPHRANLKDDYRLIQQAAEGKIRADAMEQWVRDRLTTTFVRIVPDYIDCDFSHQWVKHPDN